MARAQRIPRAAARTMVSEDAAFRHEVDELVRQLVGNRKPWALRRARRVFERAYVDYVIRKAGEDRLAAADLLDIGFSTLKEKIRRSEA